VWQQFLKHAKKDWERALERNRSDPEDAIFHLQQAVEKLLKALIYLHADEEPPRTHNLRFLLKHAVRLDKSLAKYEDACIELGGYYLTLRYPSAVELSEEELLQKAGELIEKVKPLVKRIDDLIRELTSPAR